MAIPAKEDLHKLIDEIPDEMADEILLGFKDVLVKCLAKSMMHGFSNQMADLQYCHDIIDHGGPEKNANVVRMPRK